MTHKSALTLARDALKTCTQGDWVQAAITSIDAALEEEDALQELADLSQEMGLYDEPKDSRAEFEVWLGRAAYTERSDSGKYVSAHIDGMWSAWNAARAQQGGQA